jgi:hypothetical protein
MSAPGLLAATPPPKVWKVTPDRVDPPVGLASVYTAGIPIGSFNYHGNQTTVAPKILFARPDSGQAAVLVSRLGSSVPVWLRYDLRKPPHPIAEISLSGSKERETAYARGGWTPTDLSPNGTRLAVLGNALDQFGRLDSAVGVWSADGQLIMEAREKREKHYLWAGFLDEDRLAVLAADGGLEVRDARSGAVASRQPLKWKLPVAFSPSRNWLVGYTGDGFEWRRMPGAEAAGTLSLPSGLPTDRSAPVVALSPDGTAFAAYFQAEGQHVILTWDVASGAVKDAVLYPMRDAPAKDLRVQWAGPRAVLIAGRYLVDLDLHLPVWGWDGNPGQDWDKSIPGPDWRFWRAGPLPDGDKLWGELTAKAANPPKKEQPTFLFAASPLPPPVVEHANALRDGFVLNYNQPIRAEAQGTNSGFRTAAADALAGVLSSNDFRLVGDPVAVRYTIDPAAPTAVRLRLPAPEVWLYGKPQDAVAVVNGQRVGGGSHASVRPEVVVTGRMELIDRSGNVVWTSPREIVAHEPITAAYADVEAVRRKYPEAKMNANDTPRAAVDVEAKYPELVAAVREQFLKNLAGEVRESYPAPQGMRAALSFPANDKPSQPIATGEMTVDGLPPPPPPDRRPSRLPLD